MVGFSMIRKNARFIYKNEHTRYYGTRESNVIGIKVNFIYPKRTVSYLKANGYSDKEEKKIYNDVLDDIQKNTRWYLDNLEYLSEFQVSFEDYHRKHYSRDIKRAKKAKMKTK